MAENKNAENRNMLTGMFRDRESAERAYNNLQERGYSKEDINLMMSDETRKKYFSEENDEDRKSEMMSHAMEGAGKGSAIGGAVGAVAGIIAALGTSLVIPGLGVIIAGPIAAGLAGAGAGGLTGGIIGALAGYGIPEDQARRYEKGINEGGIVMGVHPRNDQDADYFRSSWKTNHGQDIYHTAEDFAIDDKNPYR